MNVSPSRWPWLFQLHPHAPLHLRASTTLNTCVSICYEHVTSDFTCIRPCVSVCASSSRCYLYLHSLSSLRISIWLPISPLIIICHVVSLLRTTVHLYASFYARDTADSLSLIHHFAGKYSSETGYQSDTSCITCPPGYSCEGGKDKVQCPSATAPGWSYCPGDICASIGCDGVPNSGRER